MEMEAEEHNNVIRKGEKSLQRQCFWKTKAETKWFRLFLESGIQKSGIRNPEVGIRNPEGRNPESGRTAVDFVTYGPSFETDSVHFNDW